MSDKIRVTVWGENVHEKEMPRVREIYPDGMHACIAAGLNEAPDIEARTATLDMPEHGLTDEVLENTDVMTWWGHAAHHLVEDRIAQKVKTRVLEGMGLIVLHSGHYSKVFKWLMGTTCSLCWREADERERLWICNPVHPIVRGIEGRYFEIPKEEMYGEPFGIPEPQETILIGHFEGGEVFRSGCVFQRGAGKIFYFQPGHETYPIYHQAEIKLILKNAVRYVRPQGPRWIDGAPHIPVEQAPDPISKKD
ncbi:MAG: ThuA domain-containing protein [Fimbriimonadaceae bacterium]